jgi:hypothetical protein
MNGHYEYVKSMLDYIRTNLDSSRLLTHTSNSGVWNGHDPIDVSDYAQENSYGDFKKVAETLRKKWPDKPVFFSEWGRKQIGAKLDAKIPDFDKAVEATVKDHPYVMGYSIWTFNDYRSGMKGTPASGNREWGVVTVDRQPKAAYYQVRKAFSPVHAITVADGKIRIEPRTRDEVPSYPLRGYQVKWKSNDSSGTIAVPDLKPGDAPWETTVPAGGNITASLISPTGYTVDETTPAPSPGP